MQDMDTSRLLAKEFSIETGLMPAVVATRLEAAVEPERWFRPHFDAKARPFEGKVSDGGFEVRRILSYQNPILPRVSGRIEASERGTRVKGTIALYGTVNVLLLIWFACAAVGSVAGALQVSQSGDFEAIALVPFPLLILSGLLVLGSFFFEARRALSELRRVLSASDVGRERAEGAGVGATAE